MSKAKLPFAHFDWTPDLAYAVGLLVTDGCLSKDGRHITMRSAEPVLLTTFKKCLRLKNKIGYTEGQRGYRVQFGNVQLYNWLLSIGLFPAKTYTMGKIKIPDEFFRDFLRGHLDGDGNIMSYKDSYNIYKGRRYTNNRLFTRFISASNSHIVWLREKISELAGVHGALIKEWRPNTNRVPVWEIKFAKKESVKLLTWIYYQPQLPSLQRKRILAMGALNELAREKRKEYTSIEDERHRLEPYFNFGGRKFFNSMNQKGFVNIIIIIGVVVLAGVAGYFMFTKEATKIKVFANKEQCEKETGSNCIYYLCDIPIEDLYQKLCVKGLGSGWYSSKEIGDSETAQFETAQWEIYTNTEYKYRVSYPTDWELGQISVKQSPEAVRFTKISKQGDKYLNDTVVDIIVEPNPLRKTPTEEWYREWVKQIPAGINLEGVKIEETTFKNMKAIKIDNSTIFFAKGFNMFRIKWHIAGDYDQSVVESTEKIFEQMLDTFAFFD